MDPTQRDDLRTGHGIGTAHQMELSPIYGPCNGVARLAKTIVGNEDRPLENICLDGLHSDRSCWVVVPSQMALHSPTLQVSDKFVPAP